MGEKNKGEEEKVWKRREGEEEQLEKGRRSGSGEWKIKGKWSVVCWKQRQQSYSIIHNFREAWLCSLSEACALLMTSLSALIYSAVVCIGIPHCQNCVYELVHAGVFALLWLCVLLVDCLQYMKTVLARSDRFSAKHPPWSKRWARSWRTPPRFTARTLRIFFSLDVFVMLSGSGPLARIHSRVCRREIKWL